MKQILKYSFLFLIIFILSVNSIKPQGENVFLPELSTESREKAIKKLKAEIDNILSNNELSKSKFGVAVYSIDENEYYYQKNNDLQLTPASLTKLFTTFSALYLMGENHQIQTSVYYDGEIDDGVLDGDVYIYGRGDVLLSVSDLDILSDKILQKGIKKINGNIYADGSYFDDFTNRLDYSNDRDLVEPMPPITALSIEKNTATIIATSGPNVNNNVNVTVIPRTESLLIENNAKIIGSKSGTYIDYEPSNESYLAELTDRVGDAPKKRKPSGGSIRIINSSTKNGTQKFIVAGVLGVNKSYAYRYYINNPVLATAGSFKNSLINSGINVSGGIGEKKMEPQFFDNGLANFNRPLVDLIYPTNKESDNFLAENLFKSLGAYAGKNLDNSTGSREVQGKIFENIGMNFNNCQLNDGSGLSRRNLITTRSIISLLVKSQYLPFGYSFINSLAIAGTDGTLRKRMKKTNAENNVYAKTGTLRNASGLSGFVSTQDGELIAFSFVFNGPYVYNYKQTEEKLAIALANFKYE
jgi:D-alanyl-D-alanine carboxypeptidase/D-alanyl-D-alanine-endopeptidase (penicillin-binding protein 4)